MWITSKIMNVLVYSVFVVGLINTGTHGSTAVTSGQEQTSLKTDEGQTTTAMDTFSLLQTSGISAATSTPTLEVSPTLQPEGDTTNVALPDVSLFSSMSPSVELNSTLSSDVAAADLEPMVNTASIQPSVSEAYTTIYITDVASMLDTMSIDLDVSETTNFEMEPSSDVVVFSDSSFVTDALSSFEQSMSSQIIVSQNDSLIVFSDESSLTETFSSLTDSADFMSSFSEFVDSDTSFSDIGETTSYSEIIDSSVQNVDSLSSSLEDTSMQSSTATELIEPTPLSVPPSSPSTSVPIQPSPASSVIQPTSTPVVTASSPDLASAMYSSSVTESETITASVKPPISDKSHGSDGLSSGGKAAIGIVVSLCIVGLIIVGVYFYRKHQMTPGGFKQLLTNGVRYRTYNNPGYKDDEVEMEGTAMERFR